MKNKIPKELIDSKFRKEMWRNAKPVIKKMEKALPISELYMLGSFTTAKIRPQDIDVILLAKTKEKNKNSKWSVDFQIVPDNEYGRWMLEECKKWMKRKYGAKKSKFIKLKGLKRLFLMWMVF